MSTSAKLPHLSTQRDFLFFMQLLKDTGILVHQRQDSSDSTEVQRENIYLSFLLKSLLKIGDTDVPVKQLNNGEYFYDFFS